MNQSTERELRALFAADAAGAPDELVVAAAAVRRVHRRRRTLTAAAATTTAVILAAGGYIVSRPAATPQAQPPIASSSAPVASVPAADLPAGVKPGDPVGFGAESCVKAYSPKTLAENAFAFDGTVTGIGPGRTDRSPNPASLDLRSVTFQVHTWFKGGSGATATVDMASLTEDPVPAYRIGTRLLVSGMPRWGGAPLDDAVAWGCGFTRYYSPSTAAEWATAMK
ncbi:hypothetical protein [Actinoplanes sp. HUAS TT8]|uniref:hypothetical protein n=1 Tax=Actinoplanes sp. HUAS TT8 TaxID=3447453 RepID=UPI003F51EE65